MCGCLDNVYTLNFRLPLVRFFRAFPSIVRQMRGYNSQRLGTANTLPNLLFVLFFCYSCCFVVNCVVLCIVCKCVLPPGVNPIAFDKYININITN
jgi:Na+/H+-dicarboxylate symporter